MQLETPFEPLTKAFVKTLSVVPEAYYNDVLSKRYEKILEKTGQYFPDTYGKDRRPKIEEIETIVDGDEMKRTESTLIVPVEKAEVHEEGVSAEKYYDVFKEITRSAFPELSNASEEVEKAITLKEFLWFGDVNPEVEGRMRKVLEEHREEMGDSKAYEKVWKIWDNGKLAESFVSRLGDSDKKPGDPGFPEEISKWIDGYAEFAEVLDDIEDPEELERFTKEIEDYEELEQTTEEEEDRKIKEGPNKGFRSSIGRAEEGSRGKYMKRCSNGSEKSSSKGKVG